MRFHLVYHGRLPGSGNSSKPDIVRDIRDAFHPQLEELWKTHSALRRLRRTAIVHKESYGLAVSESPFDVERDVETYPARDNEIDLSAPIQRGEKSFRPLIRKSLDLNCQLKINFLRQEDPGSLVLQGGDLDNRIKTLFDALRIPDANVEDRYPQRQNYTFCLLESDALISDFDVSSGRLLFPERTHPHEVHLLIEVTVRVLRVGQWNLPLIGE
jgi:hypothetical protein